jgi:transposase
MRPAPDLSRAARVRLAMLDWHRSHGENVARTARHFGYSRPTVYRWLARFERFRLESLEDRSSRPVRRRRPTWTLAQLVAVRRQRERYPRWGKDKLAVLLRREGIGLSVSMVGRILGRLRATGELREQARRGISARRRAWRRPHAVRKPAGFVAARPGDLVQVDTLDVRPLPGLVLKQFTARDVVSPKLNGSVERANRTHTEEFYEVTDAEATLADLCPALLAWEATYNTIRPHQALGYLTPAEYLASLGLDV